MERSQIEAALMDCEFFKGLDRETIQEVIPLCQKADYAPGQKIFRQGDLGEYLYIICDGYVFLERSTDLGQRKGQVVIDAFGHGRVLGCWSTLLNEPHKLMSSAVCQKPTTVIALKGSDLRKLMDSNKDFGFIMLERLSFLLRNRIQAAYGALEKI